MKMYKQNKKLFIYLFVIIFCTFMLNHTFFTNIDTYEDSHLEVNENWSIFPEPFSIIRFSYETPVLPIEESITTNFFIASSQVVRSTPSFSYKDISIIIITIMCMKVILLMFLASFQKPRNRNSSNSIPFGGHAPPSGYFYFPVLSSVA